MKEYLMCLVATGFPQGMIVKELENKQDGFREYVKHWKLEEACCDFEKQTYRGLQFDIQEL